MFGETSSIAVSTSVSPRTCAVDAVASRRMPVVGRVALVDVQKVQAVEFKAVSPGSAGHHVLVELDELRVAEAHVLGFDSPLRMILQRVAVFVVVRAKQEVRSRNSRRRERRAAWRVSQFPPRPWDPDRRARSRTGREESGSIPSRVSASTRSRASRDRDGNRRSDGPSSCTKRRRCEASYSGC